mmetsp:Transcript_31567/g.100964  ORF Transcript_31567/g.100964 Transcript_31567/m.100964 type:complete len:674 (-) Transcript_31567:32-2053(-)
MQHPMTDERAERAPEKQRNVEYEEIELSTVRDNTEHSSEESSALKSDIELGSFSLKRLLSDKTFHDPKEDTELWTSRITYILAAVGSAVGLGNIWRFPFLCYRNGGATFLIPYFISLFALGIPLFVLETTMGQGSGKSALGAFFDISPRCKGIGYLSLISTCGIVVYYCVILAWCLRYLFATVSTLGFRGGLPWNAGAASSFYQGSILAKRFLCSPRAHLASYIRPCAPGNVSLPFYTFDQVMYAERQGCACRPAGFLHQGNLQADNVLALFIIWVLILLMCCLGTKTLKFSTYVTVPLPYVMLVALFIRGVTLPGAGLGIKYYLQPDFSKLFSDTIDPVSGEVTSAAQVWLQAATQIFFSLSLAEGAMITYASYNPPHYPIVSNVLAVALTNCFTELFAGFCVFSILGYLAEVRGARIEEVVAAGPGLVFEVIPEALSLMPSPTIFTLMFFLMLLMLGLSSAVSLVQAGIAIVKDHFLLQGDRLSPRLRTLLNVTWALPCVVCLLLFLLGLAFCRSSAEDWVNLIDTFVSNFLMTLIGGMEFVSVAWIFGLRDYSTLMKHRIDWEVNLYFKLVWRFSGPAVLGIMFVAGVAGAVRHPVTDVWWALMIGWSIGVLPVIVFLVHALLTRDHEGKRLVLPSFRSVSSFRTEDSEAIRSSDVDMSLGHRHGVSSKE